MEELSDTQAVERVLKGDKEAYRILVERYFHLAYGLALRKLRDCDMAEDVTQEAFIIGYERLERLRAPAAFGSWIAGITRNLSRSMQRSRQHTPVSLDYLTEKGIEPGTSTTANPIDVEKIEFIKQAILKLPPKYREILELRYTEGYTPAKIGAFLNLSENVVNVRLHRARKQVLKILAKEGWL